MVKSKRALHLQAARNKKTESQREKNNEDELRATKIRENEEWKIQQECAPRAMMMVETKKLQDLVNNYDCRKCGQTGNCVLINNVSFNTTI